MSSAWNIWILLKRAYFTHQGKRKQFNQRVPDKFLCKQTPKIQNKYKSTDGMRITAHLKSNMNSGSIKFQQQTLKKTTFDILLGNNFESRLEVHQMYFTNKTEASSLSTCLMSNEAEMILRYQHLIKAAASPRQQSALSLRCSWSGYRTKTLRAPDRNDG